MALLLVIPIALGHPMTWFFWFYGIIEVVGFFYFSNQFSSQWRRLPLHVIEKKLFWTALVIRLIFVILVYFFNVEVLNNYNGYMSADADSYHLYAVRGAEMIRNGQFDFREQFESLGYLKSIDISDMGYPVYQSFIYWATGDSMLLTRCIGAFFSSWTVLLLFRLAKRSFGEVVARISGVFCMLMPNLIYYSTTQNKETMMLFLTILFLERADALIREPKMNVGQLLLVLGIGGLTYFVRAILCYVLLLSFLFALVFTSQRVARKGRLALTAVLSILLIGGAFGNVIAEELELGEYQNLQEQQDKNMQWRTERNNGNSFAKYAGAAVFAPLIFTIPFPTMVNIPNQEAQQMIHGGNYVKNITSFFTILALFLLLLTGQWRDKPLPIAFMLGYLVVLVFSQYAQSERFHIPILPISLMCAAYGISQMTNIHKKWFDWWLAFIFVANVGWAWFKLRGRGM